MAKKKKALTREDRVERRSELAEFYTYAPYNGQHPVSPQDAQIMELLCEALERTNALPALRELLESWKVTRTDEDLVADLDNYLTQLPEDLKAAQEEGYVHGPMGLLEEIQKLLEEKEQPKVAVIDLQGDLLNVTSIHRLTKSSGYDTTLHLPSYLILVNKNLKEGDYISSTFTYTYYSEEAREVEWTRIKAALESFKHVKFI
jgi:hypothetical protein